MIRKRYVFSPSFLLLSLIFFMGCSSNEIKDLQSSVAKLEDRMINYQQLTSQNSAETVSRVGEVNQSINKAFRDIRYAQSNMETLVEQLSTRLSKVERDVTALQQNTSQLNTASNDTYANLTDRLSTAEQTFKSQRQQDLEAIQKNLDALSNEFGNLKSEQNRSRQSIQNLDKQIASMSEENRKIYRQILQELGAKVPEEPVKSAGKSEDSGQIHEVQKGESLGSIATKYGVSMDAIQTLNSIENPSLIQVGQRLKIPK